jgi:6-pyruvoyltetrahydropterin/6-carboxytetrahydropterin synthase
MYLVSVEKSFDAAHYIRGYGGRCEKLHGHRFKVVARLAIAKLNKIGLAFDFAELKKVLSEVISKYDHQCLNDLPPFNRVNPSSENIATEIYEELVPLFPSAVKLDSVEVWESPEACAIYKPGKE